MHLKCSHEISWLHLCFCQRVSKRGIVGGSVISCSVQVMKGGRKNLKRAVGEETLNLQEGQSVMQVLSLRGSNIIEVWIFLNSSIPLVVQILIYLFSKIRSASRLFQFLSLSRLFDFLFPTVCSYFVLVNFFWLHIFEASIQVTSFTRVPKSVDSLCRLAIHRRMIFGCSI